MRSFNKTKVFTSRYMAVLVLIALTLAIHFIFRFEANGSKGKENTFIVEHSQNTSPPPDLELLGHLQSYDPSLPTDYNGSKREQMGICGVQNHTLGKYIYQRLNGKKNGFFIEAGALDGVWLSNTIWLEQLHNWTGLLVEVDPRENVIFKKRNRRAWVADVCLATENKYPQKLNFSLLSPGQTMVPNEIRVKHEGRKRVGIFHQAKCYPLHTLLDPIGAKEVDYLCLDVEGLDLHILKTIPWHRIKIKLITVEVLTPEVSHSIQSYLETVGYKKITHLHFHYECILDDLYELLK